MVFLFYTTYISVDLAHLEIVRAKVGKGGITGGGGGYLALTVCVLALYFGSSQLANWFGYFPVMIHCISFEASYTNFVWVIVKMHGQH